MSTDFRVGSPGVLADNLPMGVEAKAPICDECDASGWKGTVGINDPSVRHKEVMNLRMFCDKCFKKGKTEGNLVHWHAYATFEDFRTKLPDMIAKLVNEIADGELQWPSAQRKTMLKLIRLAIEAQ